MILGVIEGVWCPLILRLTFRSIQDLALNPWLNIALFIPVLLAAAMIYIIIHRQNFYIYDLNQKDIYR
jgi:hypothetical protein